MWDILITGGCGFIGLNLAKYLLLNTQFNVILLDNFISSTKQTLNIFLDSLSTQHIHRLHIIENDICNEETFKNSGLQYFDIIMIYHLASIASPIYYKRFPLKTLDVGYIGTKNVLEFALKHNSKVLFTSTSEVYGDPQQHPQSEEYYGNVNTVGFRSMYDESKRVAETLINTYRQLGVNTRIVRIFNTYGPFMNINDGRIITEIIKCKLLGHQLKIFGNGKQTRSFCYIDDLIPQIIDVMNSSYMFPVNIGNDNEYSINEIVHKLQLKDKSNVFRIVYINTTDKDDPKIRKPDLSLIYSLSSHRNSINIDHGLFKTINYFKDIIDAYQSHNDTNSSS